MKHSKLPNDDRVESAKSVGLHYITDTSPGISRKRRGKGFRYTDPNGSQIRDTKILHRIRALAIPPAWQDVWICSLAHGHTQATGRDAKGRKQYRYHTRWHEVRDATKYERSIEFAKALPRLRRRVKRDMVKRGLSREKILATVVRLLETTLIRVGNEEYAKQNDSFGLTTMRTRHAKVSGATIKFQFRGKSGIQHSVDLTDPRLARIVRLCQDLPGYELFQYLDEHGERQDVQSSDVNTYLQEITGQDFTAKDFRTWAGTVLAARALQECQTFDSQAEAKRNVVRAIESVAKRLGNTKAVCRKCYIHPSVVNSYLDGSLIETLQEKVNRELAGSLRGLPPEEAAVLALLQKQLRQEKQKGKKRASTRAVA